MLDFNTVYRITINTEGDSHFGGLAIGVRPFTGDDGTGTVRDGFEWIPNSPIWERKHEFLRIDVPDPDQVVATSVLDELLGVNTTYVFEPLTLDRLSEVSYDIAGYDSIVKSVESDEDLQEFFRIDWERDSWKPNNAPETYISERAPAEVGEIRFWPSRGWVQKADRPGPDNWDDIDGPEDYTTVPEGTVRKVGRSFFQKQGDAWNPVEDGARGELPGAWKDEAEGLPKNTRNHYWDAEADAYSLDRQELHQTIIDKILEGITPVDTDRYTKHAVITMGVPASGKSEVVRDVMKSTNYAHVDPDHVREQLPEFKAAVDQRAKNGGSIVADETIHIADKAFFAAVGKGMDAVLEGVAASLEWYEKQLIPNLKKRGYKITLLMVHEPDADAAVFRAGERGKKTGRFVPEDNIRKAQPKIPKNFIHMAKLVDGFTAYQTGRPPTKMWGKDEGREIVYDQDAYEAFLKLTETDWWEVLLGSELSEGKKKPTQTSWEDFLKKMEQAWEAEQTWLDSLPDRYTDGVEIPPADMDDLEKGRRSE